MSRTALIFGVSGQDGSLLARHLLSQGDVVHGTSRDIASNAFGNLHRLNIRERVHLHSCDPTDFRSVAQIIDRVGPDEIYNLTAQSSVGLSFQKPIETFQSVELATLNMLEVIRLSHSKVRFCNAASGESFGETTRRGADESAPFRPRSPYAVAKASAFWSTANYREAFALFASSAILFNHESPLRPERFATRKIITGAAAISRGEIKGPLRLGNLNICRDWGWAEEYVDAMCRIVRAERPADFVIATGKSFTLCEFVECAFAAFELDWRNHVISVADFFRPAEIMVSTGRPQRASECLGWTAQRAMPDVVKLLAAAELAASSPL
jgi:GDPmannose 4,6-dehydratase